MQDLSYICDLCHSSWQCQILNPLNEARDQTLILMDTSQVRYHWATMGTPSSLPLESTLSPPLPSQTWAILKPHLTHKSVPDDCNFYSVSLKSGMYFTFTAGVNLDARISSEILHQYLGLIKFTVAKVNPHTQVMPNRLQSFLITFWVPGSVFFKSFPLSSLLAGCPYF